MFCKALASPFLYFKGGTHAYLLQISIMDNINPNTLVSLVIICTSARSATHIFSLKDDYTFCFLRIDLNHWLVVKVF